MDELNKNLSDNPEEMENNDFDIEIEEISFVEEEEEPASEDTKVFSWHKDEFEPSIDGVVSENKHALSLYKPKLKKHRFRNPVFAAVVSAAVTSALCFGVFALCFNSFQQTVSTQEKEQKRNSTVISVTEGTQNSDGNVVNTANTTGNTSELTIPQVYDKVSPAVVNIICTARTGSSYLQSPTTSSGSGVILTEDGYIVTNNHVVENASVITVKTIAGQSFDAKVIGKDARSDLAVLKIESEQKLPFAELGDSASLRVGDMAIAIGNPLKEALASTMTVGYISAINRTMVIDDRQMTMLQTDAAINPGNSGGALINIYGQVIGITTAKSTGYDVEGLGFAIPINEAIPVIESIIEHGYVTGRPLVGITGVDVTEQIAEAKNLPRGVYVNSVVENGAAAQAGILPGDVIVKFDGKDVKSIDEINVIRDEHKAGDTVAIEVFRNGENHTYNVTLQEEKPSDNNAVQTPTLIQPFYPSDGQDGQQYPSDFFSWFGR